MGKTIALKKFISHKAPLPLRKEIVLTCFTKPLDDMIEFTNTPDP